MKKLFNFRAVPIILLAMITSIVLVAMLGYRYGIIAIGVLATASVICLCVKSCRKWLGKVLLVTVAVIIAVTATYFSLHIPEQDYVNIYDVRICGRITADTKSDADGKVDNYAWVLDNVTYDGANYSGKIDGKLAVSFHNAEMLKDEFCVGDYIVGYGALYPERIVVTDYMKMAKYTAGITHNARLDKVVKTNITSYKTISESIMMKSRTILAENTYSNSGSVIYGMIFGDTSSIDWYNIRDFREIGIAHLFAVSGLHIGLLAGAVSYIARKCKTNKYIEYFCTLFTAVSYGLLTGFSVSVARTIIMLTVYKTAMLLRIRPCKISPVCLAGVIILTVSPLMLFTLSFQLSMLAVIGIEFFCRPIVKHLKFLPKILSETIGMTLAVNITVLPILLGAFGRVSLVFILANIVLLPIISLLFPFVLITVFLSMIVPYVNYLLVPFGYIFYGLTVVSTVLAQIPFLTITANIGSLGILFIVAILTFISPYNMMEKKIKSIVGASMLVVFCTVTLISSNHLIDTGLRINTVYTSDEYDYVMLTSENKHYLVINGALTRRGAYAVEEYMYENKISGLEAVVKSRFNDYESSVLTENYDSLNPKYLITNTANCEVKAITKINILFKDRQMVASLNDDIDISVLNVGTVLVESRKHNILFCNISRDFPEIVPPPVTHIDILFANGDYDYIPKLAPDYYVSDYGVENNIPYSIKSPFTFIIKESIIKVR